jgi:hypothetical protein
MTEHPSLIALKREEKKLEIKEVTDISGKLHEAADKIASISEKTSQLSESLPELMAQLDNLDTLESRLLELVAKKLEKA